MKGRLPDVLSVFRFRGRQLPLPPPVLGEAPHDLMFLTAPAGSWPPLSPQFPPSSVTSPPDRLHLRFFVHHSHNGVMPSLSTGLIYGDLSRGTIGGQDSEARWQLSFLKGEGIRITVVTPSREIPKASLSCSTLFFLSKFFF